MIYKIGCNWDFQTISIRYQGDQDRHFEWRQIALDMMSVEQATIGLKSFMAEWKTIMKPLDPLRKLGSFLDFIELPLIGVFDDILSNEVLRTFLEDNGALHVTPFLSGNLGIYLCENWVNNLVDLKQSRGRMVQYPSESSERYVCAGYEAIFHRNPPCGTWLFRVPEIRGALFATDEFKDFYDRNGFSGLEFTLMTIKDS